MQDPVVNIRGQQVMLGPMNASQIPTYQHWLNNFDTLQDQGEPRQMPDTIEGVRHWYESYVLGRSDVAWFTIYDQSTDEPVGWTELKDIDHLHGTAEFAIMLGEATARGKGFGTEVTRLMLSYGFERLNLHNIHLYCHEFNVAAQHVYLKAGFREYGRRHKAHVSQGRRWDIILMERLSTDSSLK